MMKVEERIRNSRPLNDEQRSVIHLFLVYHHMSEQFHHALKPYDLSLQQFNVLRILRGMKDQPANLGTLNERMVTPMSNTTRLVEKLRTKGLVTRVICPSNRRKIEIRITPQGLNLLTELDRVVASTESALMHRLSPEDHRQLNRLLDLVLEPPTREIKSSNVIHEL